ncbi:6-phosphogluconolactonase [Asticcacaulis sp.]|uniref:6-phosphogluconolactonase n=1 Tax=Asticcacaulis sp. TaxID=1872648 RepID=UPI003F7C1EEA
MLEIIRSASATEAEAACAQALSEALSEALKATPDRISFMISGGNTPRRVLPRVLAAELDWERIVVFASDERLVPVDHPDSTEGMVREIFAAAKKSLHYLGFGPSIAPVAALAFWEAALKSAAWPVSAGFIGIGEDAHFASLFPNRPEITDPDIFATAVPETAPHKHARLTLGRAAFSQVKLLTLVVSGETKRRVLEASLAKEADCKVLPAARIGEHGYAIAFTT